jgi:hypothetical protein
VSTHFSVSRLDYTLEARYQRPELDLLRDGVALANNVLKLLQPYGITLSDIKIERGDGTLSEFNLFCKLFEFGLTIRLRADRVEMIGVLVGSREQAKRYSAAGVETLVFVEKLLKGAGYATFTVQVNMHGPVTNGDLRSFLAQFVTKTPALGPATGSAVGYYYGPSEDRLSSTVIADVSGALPDSLYVRVQGVWDATRVTAQDLPARLDAYVRDTLKALNLETPDSQ